MKRKLIDEQIISLDTIVLLNRYDTKPIATIYDIKDIEIKPRGKPKRKLESRFRISSLPIRDELRISISNGKIDNLVKTTDNYLFDCFTIVIDTTSRDINTCSYSHLRIVMPWSMIEGELYAIDGVLHIKNIEINSREYCNPEFPKDWLFCCYVDEDDYEMSLREFVDAQLKKY